MAQPTADCTIPVPYSIYKKEEPMNPRLELPQPVLVSSLTQNIPEQLL
jgi:hypothetical protein